MCQNLSTMHVFDGKKLNFHFLNSLFSGIAVSHKPNQNGSTIQTGKAAFHRTQSSNFTKLGLQTKRFQLWAFTVFFVMSHEKKSNLVRLPALGKKHGSMLREGGFGFVFLALRFCAWNKHTIETPNIIQVDGVFIWFLWFPVDAEEQGIQSTRGDAMSLRIGHLELTSFFCRDGLGTLRTNWAETNVSILARKVPSY